MAVASHLEVTYAEVIKRIYYKRKMRVDQSSHSTPTKKVNKTVTLKCQTISLTWLTAGRSLSGGVFKCHHHTKALQPNLLILDELLTFSLRQCASIRKVL